MINSSFVTLISQPEKLTMDKSAIEQIQTTSGIPELLSNLASKGMDVPHFLAPEGFKLISIEGDMEFRSRYRFNYETTNIEDFLEYSRKFKTSGTSCFVDNNNMTSKTIFDLGTEEKPLHKDHKAFIRLSKTSSYKALLSCEGEVFTQKQITNFIEDWADHVLVFDKAGDLMNEREAVSSLGNLTIERAREVNSKVDDYSVSMSAMEKIEAKDSHKLPAEIHFSTVPYLHFGSRTFVIRVGLRTSSETPQLVTRVKQLESTQEKIALEFKDIVKEGLSGTGVDVYMGSGA